MLLVSQNLFLLHINTGVIKKSQMDHSLSYVVFIVIVSSSNWLFAQPHH